MKVKDLTEVIGAITVVTNSRSGPVKAKAACRITVKSPELKPGRQQKYLYDPGTKKTFGEGTQVLSN